MIQRLEQVRDKCAAMLRRFDQVIAISLAGSIALRQADEFSDVDLQAFTMGEFPSVGHRGRIYQDTPGVEIGPLDHPISGYLDVPPFSVNYVVDWLYIDGVKCDVAWFTQEGIERLLAALPANPEFPEPIGVLVRVVQPLYDPHGYVARLRKQVPEYSEERAKRKAYKNLGNAHWFICNWRVLEKAIYRKDIVAYQQAETEMVECLVAALYAINRVWQESRRRLRFYARNFTIVPDDFLERLEAVIQRKGSFQNLEDCHRELRKLFRDLCVLGNERYPGWRLPTDWLTDAVR